MRKAAVLVVLLAGIAISLCAAPPSAADIDALLRTAVEQRRLPMVVAMVADSSGIVYEHATGVPKDAIFALASMTKPVTSVAVMQLVEAGRVKLDEPASTYVAELRDLRVIDGSAERPPKTPPTVRHLLTHTSGFGYEFMNRDVADLVAKKKIASAMVGGDAFLKAPLLFDPGTQWEYGISTDWLGKLVERVSGQTLDMYFRDKIFRPLRMADSYFIVPADKQSRLAPQFQRTADGNLVEQPRQPQKSDGFFSGGGGLFGTAPDYLRFVRALLAGGQLDGQRILSENSVATMGRNQIGDLTIRPLPSLIPQFITDRAALPGAPDKFGLGFALNSNTAGTSRGANTMSWAGVVNTFFWIDRDKQIAAVVFSQMLPFLDADMKKVLDDFDRAVYAWRAETTRREPR
jgi:methyl acetate hydrolase